MHNMDEQLKTLETEANRVLLQAEQERAMAEILPVRFANNIVAFRKYIPSIAERFEAFKPEKSFRFFCNENGVPNLAWIDTDVAIYGQDPYEDCKSQISSILNFGSFFHLNYGKESNPLDFIHVDYLNKLTECKESAVKKYDILKNIPDSAPLVLSFGIGLGYQFGYLYEKCRVANLFIFEPDLDLFYASLYCFDWTSLLDYIHKENLEIHLFLGQDEKTIVEDFLDIIQQKGSFLLSCALLFWHYPSPEIFRLIEKVREKYHILLMGWGFFDDNIIALSHSVANIKNKVPLLLKNKFIDTKWKNVPVFIIANGPSLDDCIEYIKKNKNKAILVSCGSTISALHKAGLKPDIHVETERTKSVPDFLSFLNDPEYLRDILFLSTDIIHPNCIQLFERSGLCLKNLEPSKNIYDILYPEASNLACLYRSNPLVANIGLDFICTLGFKNIFLFGIDNGYKEKTNHHSKLSAYFNNKKSNVDKLTEYVTSSADYAVPGNFGGEVLTNSMFNCSREVLEITALACSEAIIHNCSDGAKIEGCLPLKPSGVDLSGNNPLDKKFIIEHIYHDMFSPFEIDVDKLDECLAVNFFNDLMDHLIFEWNVKFTSRSQILDIMQTQYKYLMFIATTDKMHIHRMLVGTFNYVFAVINSMLYQFENENDTLLLIEDAKKIIMEYFIKAKEMYPKALDSVDMVDNEIIMLFKQ